MLKQEKKKVLESTFWVFGVNANVVTEGTIIKAFEKRPTQGPLEATQSPNPVSPN